VVLSSVELIAFIIYEGGSNFSNCQYLKKQKNPNLYDGGK